MCFFGSVLWLSFQIIRSILYQHRLTFIGFERRRRGKGGEGGNEPRSINALRRTNERFRCASEEFDDVEEKLFAFTKRELAVGDFHIQKWMDARACCDGGRKLAEGAAD